MKKYQNDYAAGRSQMYDVASREEKAKRMVILLQKHFGKKKLKQLTVLDTGASTGIIANYLAPYFKKITATDIDKNAVKFAKKQFKQKNLEFRQEDAMKFSFKDDSFDIVICTHVYEHVPDASKLFSEIYRVLRPGGVCYLAALNRIWPMEPHYDLPFLAWLPKDLANSYVRLFGKANEYYETPLSYWGLKKITKQFTVKDYTPKIFSHPLQYGYANNLKKGSFTQIIGKAFAPLSSYLAPTFFWLLIKDK